MCSRLPRSNRPIIVRRFAGIVRFGQRRGFQQEVSVPGNPLLANAFFRAGYIESWGRGIEKMRRECRAHGIEPPLYDFEMAGLMLTFHANPAHLPAAGSVGSSVKKPVETLGKTPGKTPSQILALLQDDHHLTVSEMAKHLSKSESAVNRAIQKLQSARRLRRAGSRKAGYWEVQP